MAAVDPEIRRRDEDPDRNLGSGRARAWIGAGLAFAGAAALARALLGWHPAAGVLRVYLAACGLFLLLASVLVLTRGPLRRVAALALYGLWLGMLLEGMSAVALRAKTGDWHFADVGPVGFQPHPWLVGVPIPGISLSEGQKVIRHNPHGTRGRDFKPGVHAGTRRIVTLGGSTTYCAGVSEGETWPEILEADLGPGFEVINLGVPGYTTVENLIQTALLLSDLEPDVAIYYEGWNDLNVAHVENLSPDYSDVHGKAQHHALNLPGVWTGPDLAILRLADAVFLRLGWVPALGYQAIHVHGTLSGEPDPRALSLYRRNLTLIAALCHRQGIEPVFVPQILNAARPVRPFADNPAHFVPDDAVIPMLAGYNTAMREVAAEEKAAFIVEPEETPWAAEDFLDKGHLSPSGNRKLAGLLAGGLRRALPETMNPPVPARASSNPPR